MEYSLNSCEYNTEWKQQISTKDLTYLLTIKILNLGAGEIVWR